MYRKPETTVPTEYNVNRQIILEQPLPEMFQELVTTAMNREKVVTFFSDAPLTTTAKCRTVFDLCFLEAVYVLRMRSEFSAN